MTLNETQEMWAGLYTAARAAGCAAYATRCAEDAAGCRPGGGPLDEAGLAAYAAAYAAAVARHAKA